VLFVYDDGDPKVKIDGDDEARPRVAAWFDVVGAEAPSKVQDFEGADVIAVNAPDITGPAETDDQTKTEQCGLFNCW